jgi:hypothetical protein
MSNLDFDFWTNAYGKFCCVEAVKKFVDNSDAPYGFDKHDIRISANSKEKAMLFYRAIKKTKENSMSDSRYPYTYAYDYIRQAIGDDYGKGLISRSAASHAMSVIATALGHSNSEQIAIALADLAKTKGGTT